MASNPQCLSLATRFIKSYYEVLSESPADLYKFFNSDCHFLHDENNQTQVAADSIDSVRKACESEIKLKGAKVDLSNGFIDAQPSENGGILVVVTGQYNPPDGITSGSFVQTFFLACKPSQKTYFVRNSVFRMLQADQAATTSTDVSKFNTNDEAAAASMPSSSSETVEEEKEEEEVVDTAAIVDTGSVEDKPLVKEQDKEEQVEEEEESVVEEENEAVEPKQEVKTDEQSEISTPAPVETNTSSAPTPPAPTPVSSVFSWADVARMQKDGGNVSVLSSSTQAVSSPVVESGPPAAVAPTKESANGKTTYSLYANPIPSEATSADISAAFACFGRVLHVDHAAGRAFAFIKVDSQATMKAALDPANGPIMVLGKTLKVQERTSLKGNDGTGGSRGGRGKSGRGDRDRGDRSEKAGRSSEMKKKALK